MRNILQLLALTTILLLASSCEKDFEKINQNPYFPTQTDIGPLFNSVIESLQLGWNEQFYLHNETLYAITEQAALTAATFQNITIGTEEVWRQYYLALANIRELERRFDAWEGDPEALNNVRAQVKILLAYKTFHVTDLFGDIPFFDAGRGFESLDYIEPKFDDQEAIYKFLLDELKWASDHLNLLPDPVTTKGEPYVQFGDFDNLFDGDPLLWKKFANALRLRHALRMVEKDPAFAEPVIQDVLENDLPLITAGEDVCLYPSKLAWVKESTHWSFREHKKLRMGSTIWHQLSTIDSKDGSGIFDPRTRIFFETNNAGEWVAYPQIPDASTPAEGGIPYQSHRDFNYNLKGAANLFSPFNYYLIRDQDYVPEIILTAAEVNFIKAEIYLRGLGVAADQDQAEAEYTEGVVNSLKFWQDVFVNTPIWVNAPPVLTEGEFFQIVNHPRISIFTNQNKLELIYAQRWLDAFRQPWEAYSLLRRTGATPREKPMPEYYRFSYPPSEVENNPQKWAEQLSKMGEDSPRVKVWWMP
ncbi:MAG: SusD/RagB family nutrient-binding outer membrane lipoprotein [Lewinellaceae bacterium]|nr:SusD/RagB family nutrient-binding outer membrane lipoprotein [Lewinellaceae bacterium]